MRALSTIELLGVWERAAGQPPVQRALALLAAVHPDLALDELASLSIGQRDARLLELRELTFGTQVAALATCPICGERVELAFSTGDLQALRGSEPPATLQANLDGHALRFRLPNSSDLAALDGISELEACRHQLLDRCLRAREDALASGESPSLTLPSETSRLLDRDPLPPNVVVAVVEQMAKANPLADLQLALACSLCGHEWEAPFDIVSFFWRELDAWAHGILGEIHTLAAAYGWREADILSLSPARRQTYLEMVSA